MQENLLSFRDLFLGTTHNASACKILNSHVLDFSTDHDGIFRAAAAEPLHIVNNALGYNIQLLLEYFEYIPELEENRYRMDMNETRGIRKQRSLIQLNVDTLIIDSSGHFYNPFGVRTYGYWAWEKVTEMLPFDYQPPERPAEER